MSKIGTVVVFVGCSDAQRRWGGHDDPNGVCRVGEEYTIASVEVHSWYTKVELVGIEGRFNSVCFEAARDAEESGG